MMLTTPAPFVNQPLPATHTIFTPHNIIKQNKFLYSIMRYNTYE